MYTSLTICLHQILGIVYSISETGIAISLIAVILLLSAGFLRGGIFLAESLRTTSKLKTRLLNVVRKVQASDLVPGPDPDYAVNIVPDNVNPAAFTLGWTKPEIFLTTALVRDFDPDSLSIVIHHEKGHVVRRDPLTYMILDTLAELLWFIPIVRHYVVRVRLRAELSCDAIAVSKGYSETDVARTLTRVAEAPAGAGIKTRPAFSSILDQIEIRIRALLGENPLALSRIPLKAILVSNLIVLALLLSLSTGIAMQVDPGGYVSVIRDSSIACTEGHPDVDILDQLGLECPHCGTSELPSHTSSAPADCHTN